MSKRSRSAVTTLALAAAITLPVGAAYAAGPGQAQAAAPLAAKCAYTPASATTKTAEQSPIDARYASEPALQRLLGKPVGKEMGDGIRWREYEHGRLYWSEATGVREVHGAILELYLKLGGHETFGAPITDECNAVHPGKYDHFTGTSATGVTSIYWRPDLGANLIYGPVRAHWERANWERGTYGHPVTNTQETSDGSGLFNHFTGGDNHGASIYWSKASGVHGVKGKIRERWLAEGGIESFLGYPTSDEFDTSVGKRSNFQGGYITWNRSTGEVKVFPG